MLDCTLNDFFNAVTFSQASEATEMYCNVMEMSCELEFEEHCPIKGSYFSTLELQKVSASAYGRLLINVEFQWINRRDLNLMSAYGRCPQAEVRL